ncbi:hypothetical protein A3D77_00340 [Candidatus Gottesmanbacteria bacterium RIFCSPHIGHO2_02_FULL_39_11]|uniref:Methyltransferase type 11 domain-containing protein n=1 Tax=Candidatus Gottesmanbacteria bacterium RIFCSPHIGHO2_02_FULL_39_11 TaxID=1798382 RepID=A0A1F5ZL44_9BACT|nr:MAG: hypothetical protein A3D77_00340 [Candidatus Gottesmanbacteria bacterium RIFCSPHIGHO2_02_FULL_39_11]
MDNNLNFFLKSYLHERPFFLSLIRAKELSLYEKYVHFKGKILDVGCGDGFFAKVLFTKNPGDQSHNGIPRHAPGAARDDIISHDVVSLTGLDIKESRMEEAKALNVYDKIVEYDGERMPFKPNTFDTVFSNCVLEHVEKLDEVLKETYRILVKGGIFIAPVMAKPWEENLVGSLLFGNSYKAWMRKKQVHVNLLTSEEWDRHFKKAGFKIEKKEGYLSPRACMLMDAAHYLSVPSLISRILFKRWVLFPSLTVKLYPFNYIEKILTEPVEVSKSGAIFYVLKK